MAKKPGGPVRAICRFPHRYLNGARGVISLFLAILMVPFLSIAGALINLGRINSAVAVFDEALCNASNSTLGTYDAFLKSRFGLLAMSQDTGGEGAGYTAQQLIEDTFQEYMRLNVGALSNTYFDAQTSAAGIYPLSDPNVLITQIDEYGKYTLPTKMVISGLSLDSLLETLTSAGDTVGGIFDTIGSVAGLADDCMTLGENIDTLKTSIETAEGAQGSKDTAYTAFSNAQAEYNTAVTKRAEALAENTAAVSEGKTTVQEKQSALDTAAQAQRALVDQLTALEEREAATREEKEAKEAEIQTFKDDHKDELKDYLDARQALEDAKDTLAGAEGETASIEAAHASILATKRAALKTARDDYVSKLEAFASAIESVGNGAIEVQETRKSLVSSGISIAGSVAGNIMDVATDSNEKTQKQLTTQYNKAAAEGRTDDMDAISGQIADVKNKKQALKKADVLTGAGFSAAGDGIEETAYFYQKDFKSIYASAYQSIINTKAKVKEYSVPGRDDQSAAGVSSYQVTVPVGITTGEVDKLEEEAASSVVGAPFFGVCKAILSFIKALFSLSIFYDWELTSTVSGDYYADQGRLPSQRDRKDDRYSLVSEYDEADREQSEAYKKLLDSYVDATGILLSGNSLGDILSKIMTDINTVLDCMDGLGGLGFFRKAGELINAIAVLVGDFQTLFDSFTGLDGIKSAVQQRMLLASYIGYNTPNRTTYTGSALTGASFSDSLPHIGDNSGMGFWGAETEYIIEGCASETENQTRTFWKVYLVRFICDLVFVTINPEVAQLAADATAATAVIGGWGGLLVYIAYYLLEPFVDTLVLVNGSTVPIVKLKIYLTPTGLPELIKAFLKMPIKDKATRESVQSELNKTTSAIKPGTEAVTLPDKPDASSGTSGGVSQDDLLSAINMDYTETLILLMMIHLPEESIQRLGDVIQMEATCKAKDDISPYAFNLDHSYTCIRASGQFDGHEFIKLSDTGILTSTDRVIYRGY